MHGDVPWPNDVAAEPARMNWPRVILTLANRQSVVAEWMIGKMAAGITLLGADTRGRMQINGLAGLYVKVLTNTTTRDGAILQCSAVMEEMGVCMNEITIY